MPIELRNSLSEAIEVIRDHEVINRSRFAVFTSSKGFGKTDIQSAKKVYFRDQPSVKYGRLEYTGTPFVVLGFKTFDCQFGTDRKLKAKSKRKELPAEHSYAKGRKFLLQPTKKVECPARVVVREIGIFPNNKVDSDIPERCLRGAASALLQKIRNDEDIYWERRFVIVLPEIKEHSNHPIDETIPEPIDPRLSSKVKELCREGVRGVEVIKAQLSHFVNSICQPLPHPSNKRFYPSDKTIRNHIYMANKERHVDDQMNVLTLTNDWSAERPDDFFFCRTKNGTPNDDTEKTDSFLFVHQSAEMKHLVCRYGETLYFDATYKCSLYDLPLFFLVVKTNVDYQIVGTFITEDETIKSIEEGLRILQRNCHQLRPSAILTDFSESQIAALEHIFPEAKILLCDFHRSQSWERWAKKKDNGRGRRDQILQHLRSIAEASTVEQMEAKLKVLQTTPLWHENERLRDYLMKTWMPHKERWCRAYRKDIVAAVAGTTNGVETQHRILKKKFLKDKTTFNLANMLKVVVADFLPSRYRWYKDQNQIVAGEYRKFNTDVPDFLHGRPRQFIRHCMGRIEASMRIDKSSATLSGNEYTVVCGRKVVTGTLGNAHCLPRCDCLEWSKQFIPCIHMFAVMRIETGIEWTRLSQKYRDSVYTTADYGHMDDSTEDDIMEQNASHNAAADATNTSFEVTDSAKQVDQLATEARESLKRIVGLTYLIVDAKPLKDIRDASDSLYELHQSSVPSVDGLKLTPLKRRLSKKQRKRKRLTKGTIPLRPVHSYDLHRTPPPPPVITPVHTTSQLPSLTPSHDTSPPPVLTPVHTTSQLPSLTPSHDTSPPPVLTPVHTTSQLPSLTPSHGPSQAPSLTTSQGSLQPPVLTTVHTTAQTPSLTPSHGPSQAPSLTPSHGSLQLPVIISDEESQRNDSEHDNQQLGDAGLDLEDVHKLPVTNTPFLKVGDYVLSTSSFNNLRSELSDELIDAYIELRLKNRKDILYINTVVATSIFVNTSELHCFLRQTNIYAYDKLICPVNRDFHWVVVIAEPKKLTLTYINSFGETNRNKSRLLKNWQQFLNGRVQRNLDTAVQRWSVVTVPHAKQMDSTSCGMFVLKFVDNILDGQECLKQWSLVDIEEDRQRIGRILLQAGKRINAPKGRPKDSTVQKRKKLQLVRPRHVKKAKSTYCICQKPDDGRLYFECDRCKNWFHPQCLGIRKEPEKFYCPECTKMRSIRSHLRRT